MAADAPPKATSTPTQVHAVVLFIKLRDRVASVVHATTPACGKPVSKNDRHRLHFATFRVEGCAMPDSLIIARSGDIELALLPALANRHGLITGATGTGKTVTLQVLAERMSAIGVPVFMADVKGDLAGMSQPGLTSAKFEERLKLVGADAPKFTGFPAVFWDVFGEQGHPVR